MKKHSLFTDHVRDLLTGGNSVSEELIERLKVDLVFNLNRRGLTPPSLGYSGNDWTGEAIDDIAFHCYAYAFIGLDGNLGRQRAYLESKVQDGKSIEGLVRNKINWFVQELHQKKYPKDSGVYKNLVKALRGIVSEVPPKLFWLNASEKINSRSIFGKEDSPIDQCILVDELGEFVVNSKVWDAAFAKIARFSDAATALAKTAIHATADGGKIPFLFGDVKTVVSAEIKEINESAGDEDSEWEFSEDENPKKVRTEGFDTRYEDKETREQVVAAVYEAIEGLPKGENTKRQLRLVFDSFLEKRLVAGVGEKVKQADVRKELGIARSTMSDYVKTLEGLEDPIIRRILG